MSIGSIRRRRTAVDSWMERRLPPVGYRTVARGKQELRGVLRGRIGEGRVLPDFVIIGAVKGGTTSLFHTLLQHPYVAGSTLKEVHFFDYNYWRGESWYRSVFPLAADRDAFAVEHGRPFVTGEASPSYLSHPRARDRIATLLPQAKLIISLRNPVDRAYSHFQMSRVMGEEPLSSFEAALDAEPARLAGEPERMLRKPHYKSLPLGSWSYLLRGQYAQQITAWLQRFDRADIHVTSLEEMVRSPQETLDQIHDFLGIPAHEQPELRRMNRNSYDPLSPELRQRLEDYYEPHNQRLYELLGRDFGWNRR